MSEWIKCDPPRTIKEAFDNEPEFRELVTKAELEDVVQEEPKMLVRDFIEELCDAQDREVQRIFRENPEMTAKEFLQRLHDGTLPIPKIKVN